MRPTLVIALIIASAAGSLGADRPIPQDGARMQKRSRDRLVWNRLTLRGAYDRIGEKDPRWDGAAREALDLAARMFSQQVDPVVTLSEIHVAAKKAVDAGCKDPMILYLYARSSVEANFPQQEEYARRIQAAADAMSAGKSSPYRRAVAGQMALELRAWKKDPTPEEKLEVQRGLDALVDLLPRSIAEDARNEDWEVGWFTTLDSIIALQRKAGGDYKAAYDRVDAKLAKVPGIEALRLTVRGQFQIHWGWEARSTAFAHAVTEEQFRLFDARLRDARDALNAAWEAKPGAPEVAKLMLTVEKAIGGGDREAMETWFERAMTTDGNDQDACWSKLDWLDPKWHGGDSPDEMMAFGKACRATKNWQAGITLLAANVHLRYYIMLRPGERAPYMSSPEVWSEIEAVYDEYLKHYPRDREARSKYAVLCFLATHYPEAHAQFEALGDGFIRWTSFPTFTLESIQRMREDAAKVVGGKAHPEGATAPKGDGRPNP